MICTGALLVANWGEDTPTMPVRPKASFATDHVPASDDEAHSRRRPAAAAAICLVCVQRSGLDQAIRLACPSSRDLPAGTSAVRYRSRPKRLSQVALCGVAGSRRWDVWVWAGVEGGDLLMVVLVRVRVLGLPGGENEADGVVGEVAPLDRPLVVLFDQEHASEGDRRPMVGVDPDDVGAATAVDADAAGTALLAAAGGKRGVRLANVPDDEPASIAMRELGARLVARHTSC